MIWKIIGAVYVIGWIYLIWEAWKAPTMPDDYDKDYPN
jgi:hypothetical protein|tara:strand:+ start:735 stop:848 length:114 start_codon:yes stop_codon:yes gene_type:complete